MSVQFFAACFSGYMIVSVPCFCGNIGENVSVLAWLRISCLSLPFSLVKCPKSLRARGLLWGGHCGVWAILGYPSGFPTDM